MRDKKPVPPERIPADSRSATYTCDDTVFIDESLVRKIKRKAIRMQSQLSLHFAGVHYQQCMEELGLWDIGKESSR